jgi:hypothetical protein
MKRDPRSATLVPGHQFGVALAGLSMTPFGLHAFDGRGGDTVRFAPG